ncbi:MAG TPA: hypothetical protein VG125_25350 [Pirellulales bacterium]|jgi:glucose/arabinose dehydrogenase|nr:hypothetical protein [Pirellulales bacterium]
MAGLTSWARFLTWLAAASFLTSGLSAADPSTARFQLPDGFTVEQIAGPPLVRYPLFVSFDDRGRMYVAEGTGTNLPGAELAAEPLGRILLLEDKDADGRFDASQVFADKLVFPQGVLWHDGAVYAASHPSIWRLEDTDGDGVADRREELLTGFKFNGNGCDIHGPFLGPDGRLYWTDGRAQLFRSSSCAGSMNLIRNWRPSAAMRPSGRRFVSPRWNASHRGGGNSTPTRSSCWPGSFRKTPSRCCGSPPPARSGAARLTRSSLSRWRAG